MAEKTTIVFATNNPHKMREVRELFGDKYTFLSLRDIHCTDELPETTNTIEGNAEQKARYVFDHFGHHCFADDTGLEIDALGGEPGVHSAYYAGQDRNAAANMALALQKLGNRTDRGAQFRTVIALMLYGQLHLFEGVVRGRIGHAPVGTGGFGYDPIFLPEGHERTFGEMSADEKNTISHRGRAIAKLRAFLQQQ